MNIGFNRDAEGKRERERERNVQIYVDINKEEWVDRWKDMIIYI